MSIEIHAIKVERVANEKEQALIRSTETARFDGIAKRLKASINEITGGKSFCYVEIRGNATFPGKLLVSLLGKGDTALSDVHITILDEDEFSRFRLNITEGLLASIQKAFDFPLPTHYSGLIRKLYMADVAPSVMSKSYNAFIRARNGNFQEILRLHRAGSTWLLAKRVSAGYWDKTEGLVLEEMDKEFPKDVLATDKEWHGSDRLGRLEIQ